MLSRALWQRPKTLIDCKAPSGWTFVRRWALLCSSTRAFSCLANSIPTASVAAILSLREKASGLWSFFSIKTEQEAFFAPTRLTLANPFLPASGLTGLNRHFFEHLSPLKKALYARRVRSVFIVKNDQKRTRCSRIAAFSSPAIVMPTLWIYLTRSTGRSPHASRDALLTTGWNPQLQSPFAQARFSNLPPGRSPLQSCRRL